MGEWFLEFDCKKTLDIGAMTGGCIEYVTKLGIEMDGVQFTNDLKTLATKRLRKFGIKSNLFVSGLGESLDVPSGNKYDGIVSLGWFNLPLTVSYMKHYLKRVSDLLTPAGIFLFDFFRFSYIIVSSTELIELDKNILLISTNKLLNKNLLRQYHIWIVNDTKIFTEFNDLVDINLNTVRRLLNESGLSLVRHSFLPLNYPREFCIAKHMK